MYSSIPQLAELLQPDHFKKGNEIQSSSAFQLKTFGMFKTKEHVYFNQP